MGEETHKQYGLLGRTLGHSFSPRIHQLLGGYDYRLFEKEPEELEQRTSLQRAVAEKLRRGEPIGSARGFLAFLK